MKLDIVIEPTYSVKWPMVRVSINGVILYEGECKPNHKDYFKLTFDHQVKSRNMLEIEHFDKNGKETILDSEGNIISDRAISLKSIAFDELPVPEVVLYQQKFFPKWPDQPAVLKGNLYFGFNGIFTMEFGDDSEKIYFNNLLTKELIANINNKKTMQLPSGETVETFEFNGSTVNANEPDTTTIETLYERVLY